MVDKTEVKQKITILVEKYQRILNSSNVKVYNEEMTKKDFILPLFEAKHFKNDIRALNFSLHISNN